MNLYHSSRNVLYLGWVYCIVVVVVSNEEPQMSPYTSITAVAMSSIMGVYTVLLLLSCPMKSLRCLHTSLSQQLQCPLSWVASDVSIHLYHSSCNVLYHGYVYCIVVVVVSNEEPQMSPYISITAVAMSSILAGYSVLLLLSCPMKSLRCLHTPLSQQLQCPLSWMSPYIYITAVAMSSIMGVYTVLLLLSCPMKSLRCLNVSLSQQSQYLCLFSNVINYKLLPLSVRPLLREVFASCEVPLDLQAWLFGIGLHPKAMKLTSVAKATIYKYHLGFEIGNTSQHLDLPTLWESTHAVHRWRSLSRGGRYQ
ncbi:hypothetical protein LAZ67_11002702 [Cordylochernes scorpioides]|uniref:Uncharacterized protein n=1 Tax=Cordylochernes scorpioides TaxID=51811 RepID=A0ABY6KZE7_9ARAC|nr:hypothetical protein LAZ67_11002702 [Cordylochernes scorpioides]